jgi:uncharacterized protein YeaO (DUF488 family)
MLKIKRAYEPAASTDGVRILVDRLWPRGLTKEKAELDEWLRELAPSDALRKWFGHAPERFADFEKRYDRELEREPARTLIGELAQRAARGTVTLVYAAKDAEHNNAVVLAQAINRRARSTRAPTKRAPTPRAPSTRTTTAAAASPRGGPRRGPARPRGVRQPTRAGGTARPTRQRPAAH